MPRLIDADALYISLTKEAAHRVMHSDGSQFDVGRTNGIVYARDTIRDAPTIDPVKHAKWEYGIDHYKPPLSEPYDLVTSLICSACGYRWTGKQGVEYGDKPNYCPSCPAKMDGDGDA